MTLHLFRPCICKFHNGKQCFNCLNGAHDLCRYGCKIKHSKQIGVTIVVKQTKKGVLK